MNARATFDLLLTGFWLGSAQVGLGFHLMRSQGAGAGFYFALLALWLAGSLAAVAWRVPPRAGSALRLGAMAAFGLAALWTRDLPFSAWSLGAALAAILACGAFAGWFLVDRAGAGREVARVLFYENNGFILGYAVAGTLLFFSIPAIDAVTVAAMAASLLLDPARASHTRRPAGDPRGLVGDPVPPGGKAEADNTPAIAAGQAVPAGGAAKGETPPGPPRPPVFPGHVSPNGPPDRGSGAGDGSEPG